MKLKKKKFSHLANEFDFHQKNEFAKHLYDLSQ